MRYLNHIFARQWFNAYQTNEKLNKLNEFEKHLSVGNYSCAKDVLDRNQGLAENMRRLYKRLEYIRRRHNNGKITIRYVGFWSSFDITNNPLSDMLIKCAKALNMRLQFLDHNDRHSEEDIVICSCYSDVIDNVSEKALRIAYIPEPVYPDYGDFDYSISQYSGGCQGRNIYLPLYIYELKCQFIASYYPDKNEQPIDARNVYSGRNIEKEPNKDVCIISGNATSLRNEIIESIEANGLNVDKYGSTYSNRVSNKYELKDIFKFHICPENALIPGYISEKIVHAKACNAVPIYCCPDYHTDIINRESIININPCDVSGSLKEFKKESLDSIYKQKIVEPLFKKPYNYDALNSKIIDILRYYL